MPWIIVGIFCGLLLAHCQHTSDAEAGPEPVVVELIEGEAHDYNGL